MPCLTLRTLISRRSNSGTRSHMNSTYECSGDPATMRFGAHMSKSRRQFLTNASLGLLGAVAIEAQEPPPGAPPAFGVGPSVGPAVTPSTFAAAEKLVQVQLTAAERAVAAGAWRNTMAPLYERRTGPRKIVLEPSLAPGSRWDPMLPGLKPGPERDRFVRSKNDPGPLPASDQDIAFAPLTQLSRWIEDRKLSSE